MQGSFMSHFSFEPAAGKPTSGSFVPFLLLLLVLLAPGCDAKKDLIRLGMINAPLCYLLAVAILGLLRQIWRWREPDTLLRPGVLAIPFLLLSLAVVASLGIAWDGSRDSSNIITAAILFSPIIMPIVGGALCVPLLLIWRLWFALSPRDSFEGASLVATALFFAPGLLRLFDVVPTSKGFVENLGLLCFYMSGVAVPLMLILIVEAFIVKSNAAKRQE